MTTFSRGQVVVVPFPFTDLSGVKRRPALVVSSEEYNQRTGDVIIAQITSRVNSPQRPGDYNVKDWKGAGLLAPSLIRARMTTLHSSILVRVLGQMPAAEMHAVNRALESALSLC